uniref:alpha/beta fold hydrolase n=1 Tax=Thaumasiovibrio occultus TaxID=1891184 RepID=UPI000B34D783|nr:alpha/beta hydrolase [Thaumasiovibrio occultus]
MIFESDKFQLAYRLYNQTGKANTIVFLNGVFHGEDTWVKQKRLRPLLASNQLLFIDYPGCNGAKVHQPFSYDELCQALIALFKELNLQHVTAIGYSLGGVIAVDLALRDPTLFERLVLLNTGKSISVHGRFLINNVRHAMAEDLPMSSTFCNVFPWFFSERYLTALDGMYDQVLKRYMDYNSDRHGIGLLLDAVSGRGPRGEGQLAIPAMLLGTEGDPICSASQQQALIERFPSIEYHAIASTSHAANIEHYQWINQHIVDFMERHHGL